MTSRLAPCEFSVECIRLLSTSLTAIPMEIIIQTYTSNLLYVTIPRLLYDLKHVVLCAGVDMVVTIHNRKHDD